NCVSSYIQNVIDGKCHILFMRKKDNLSKSLVTIEVKKAKKQVNLVLDEINNK
ncbi:PcfJ domain-containing protein, partial [Clostridioides difficile]